MYKLKLYCNNVYTCIGGMSNKNKINLTKNTLIKTQSKHFFIKYLLNKGYIHVVKEERPLTKEFNNDSEFEISSTSRDYNYMLNENIDLKELTNPNNVHITIGDIIKDYRYFKKNFYSIESNEFSRHYHNTFDNNQLSSNYQNDNDNEQNNGNLPFNESNITLTKLIKFWFINQVQSTWEMATIKFCIVMVFITSYALYKYHSMKRINDYLIKNYKENMKDVKDKEFKNEEFEKNRTIV